MLGTFFIVTSLTEDIPITQLFYLPTG